MKQLELDLIKKYTEKDILEFSASRISLFFTCPRQFLFRYMYSWRPEDKPVQIQWPGTGFGQATHDVLEWVCNKINDGYDIKRFDKEIEGKFKTFYDQWFI